MGEIFGLLGRNPEPCARIVAGGGVFDLLGAYSLNPRKIKLRLYSGLAEIQSLVMGDRQLDRMRRF